MGHAQRGKSQATPAIDFEVRESFLDLGEEKQNERIRRLVTGIIQGVQAIQEAKARNGDGNSRPKTAPLQIFKFQLGLYSGSLPAMKFVKGFGDFSSSANP